MPSSRPRRTAPPSPASCGPAPDRCYLSDLFPPGRVRGRPGGNRSRTDGEDPRRDEPAVLDDQFTHRPLRLAPLVGRRAGIETALTVVRLVPRGVRVAEDDEVGGGEHPLEPGRPAGLR